MRVVESIKEMQEMKVDGFVPTMGYLHEGHLSLIKRAKEECKFVVVSIFVNPKQFGDDEDLDSYPQDLERDKKLCEDLGVDVLFVPKVEDMYDNCLTSVNVSKITEKLCGLSRPTHFTGVATVVAKLFNIVKCKKAYFGEKDYQQLLVIKKMVKDLNFPVEVIGCPIVREKDGLAMSSRNKYLSERENAALLYKSLKMAEEAVSAGETSVHDIKKLITDTIKGGEIDYVEVLDAETLDELEIIGGSVLIALAVKFGKARLIDNIVIK